jgi:protein-serine/threonine kinase
MLVLDSADAAQSEGECPDGSDKPPLDGITFHTFSHPKSSIIVNGTTDPSHSPMQPPKVVKGVVGTPFSATTSATDSPSPSESGSWSAPSTRPPSQAVSRAPSMSGGTSGNKLVVPPISKTQQKAKPSPAPPTTRSRASSDAHSDGGHKFTLKSLVAASAPRLSRKSSARSTSSRKSDSDADRKSVAGESAVSLTQKYGVCQKIAIGKGATAVVRLAHKWDRSEEKLYAVKVRRPASSPVVAHYDPGAYHLFRSSGKDERMNRRRSTSRNSPQSFVFPPRYTMPTLLRRWISFRTRTNIGAR